MYNIFSEQKRITRLVSLSTLLTFSVLTMNCSTSSAPADETAGIRVTDTDGKVQEQQGRYQEMVEPLLKIHEFTADGVVSADPGVLLTAQQSIFSGKNGAKLVLKRDASGLSVDTAQSTIQSPFTINWNADYTRIEVTTPGGVVLVEPFGVKAGDAQKLAGALALNVLSLGDQDFLHGADGAGVPYVAPVVLIFGIVFGSWALCVTLGVGACATMCYFNCKYGVQSSSMNCGVNITPGTGGSALGSCTCNCLPPPAGT
jgi:hypothetical protein